MHAYQPERLNHSEEKSFPGLEFFSQNAALCCGAALSVFVIGSILVNATYFQDGKHPSPMFSTRNLPVVKPISNDVASTDVKKVATNKSVQETSADQSQTAKDLLREVQTALSVRGYYAGKLDGIYGSRTRKAISAFQADQSLDKTGQPSVRLLTQILMSASAAPKEVPLPKSNQLAQKPGKTQKVAETSPKPQVDGLVAQIQSGLRNYGYDDLKVDGKMGQQTATAIQRFQLDYGMKITGEPSMRVLKKLSEIGAYRQG